jgi:hypothetical protein
MTTFTPDQWIIIGLVFVLGLLVGMWLTSGGRRKWKARYNDELEQRRRLEREHNEREAHWTTREKEWREQDSLRGAAARDRDIPRRDTDRDGVPDRDDRRPIDDRRA